MGIALVHHKEFDTNCAHDLYHALFNINHTGQECAGLSVYNGYMIRPPLRHEGLVREFRIPEYYKGHSGIGSVSKFLYKQPLIYNSSNLGGFALAFDGYIINRSELRKELGEQFSKSNDVEIAAELISQGKDFIDGVDIFANKMKGSYCLDIMTQEGETYAARCPLAVKPLMIGEGKNGYAAITESRAFRKISMKPVRDLEPGEIVKVDNNGFHTVKLVDGRTGRKRKHCSFLWAYYSWVDSIIEKLPVSTFRESVGAILARKDMEEGIEVDVAIGIPDSGKAYAEGYAEEYGCRFSEGEIKYPYAIRSYDRPTQEKRDEEADTKHSTVDSRIRGKNIVVTDDSIRRGTVFRQGPLRYLKAASPKSIHLRIGSPRNIAYCLLDDIPPEGTALLLANQLKTDEEMAEYFGIDSVRFIEVDEFVDVLVHGTGLKRDDFSLGCYTGDFSFLQ
jgi:amidophosphoribosyltransferase